ncbi:pirin family protein [Bacteroides sp. 519]|uniref:pirin family protein n=1 Tax=Bacteroides sp. 519 TaxID=2302937 RepID=UPI0013D7365C|nr:pirin family protein [Bacteroides sp. 519]NDV59793.1 pirin family protein [Bacteroides sp. 519]
MKTIYHKANTRGHSLYDWLDSKHTFSFDQYYDPERVNFGALRVLNDDRVAPGEGFGMHPHKNMEIISIPLKGELQHGDSHKNSKVVSPGLIQTMSAGTGIYHSEMNYSHTEPMEFLQIWVIPKQNNTQPQYNDYDIRSLLERNKMTTIVAPDGSAPAKMLQNTWFSIGEIEKGRTIDYKMHQSNTGVYIFLIEGEIKVGDQVLERRDGLGIYDTSDFTIETIKDSHILLMEVPMI